MTDDEQLAAKIEEHAKHGSHAYPPLLYAAAERLYALSALCALLKASLAQAEREAEKATESAEPFGYFRVTPFGWEDCAATDEGALALYERPAPTVVSGQEGHSIPIYSAPRPDRVAEELVRFCPGCGSVGPVPAEYHDCCPDGSKARAAVAAEREECAKVAAKIGDDLDEDGRIFLPCEVAYRCESAIRARGAKGGDKC